MLKTKYLTIIVLILCAGLTSCFVNRLAQDKVYEVTYKGVKYKLLKAAENSFMNSNTGGYATVRDKVSGEKGKYYLIVLEMNNQSSSSVAVNLNSILLCDDSMRCSAPTRIEMHSTIDIPSASYISIPAQTTEIRDFIFPAPNTFRPCKIVLNQSDTTCLHFDYRK